MKFWKTIQKNRGYISGVLIVFSLLNFEPVLSHLETVNTVVKGKQYISISPIGQLGYWLPIVQPLPVLLFGFLGLISFLLGWFLLNKRKKRKLYRCWLLALIISVVALVIEYITYGEWLLGGLMMRYLLFFSVFLSILLITGDKTFWFSGSLTALSWDLSSAIFASIRNESIFITVPVPYYGNYEFQALGVPTLVVICFDIGLLIFSFVIWKSKVTLLGFFENRSQQKRL